MPDEPITNLLPSLRTRREYFDFLDKWTVGTVDDLRAHMSPHALVKAFLLETSRTNGSRNSVDALAGADQRMSQVDETMYRVQSPSEKEDWALVDVEDERYPVIYTALESREASVRIDRLLQKSPLLDRAWFAAPMFRRLWQLVLGAYPEYRFTRMVFEHESVYEAFAEDDEGAEFEQGSEITAEDPPESMTERRRARIQITERIGKLNNALDQMRKEYNPLESIVQLRVPAAHRGGHDVYFDGRFTNRSDSVTSLRQTVSTVKEIYQGTTQRAEEAAWPRIPEEAIAHQGLSLGLPLLITFNEELELTTFDRWISTLRRKNNRFRLWGTPIEMGPGKVHLYAVDNHLWQPIDLEITRTHLYALLPRGTCGNTIHRLIANVQRFVDPKPHAFIGNEPYEEFIRQASSETPEE